jgi:hypothetical protein
VSEEVTVSQDPHGATFQETAFSIVTAVKSSNPTLKLNFVEIITSVIIFELLKSFKQ